jgi:hypothetical protein
MRQALVDTPMMRTVRLWICIMEKPYKRPQEYGSSVPEAARRDADGWLARSGRLAGTLRGAGLRPTARTERIFSALAFVCPCPRRVQISLFWAWFLGLQRRHTCADAGDAAAVRGSPLRVADRLCRPIALTSAAGSPPLALVRLRLRLIGAPPLASWRGWPDLGPRDSRDVGGMAGTRRRVARGRAGAAGGEGPGTGCPAWALLGMF